MKLLFIFRGDGVGGAEKSMHRLVSDTMFSDIVQTEIWTQDSTEIFLQQFCGKENKTTMIDNPKNFYTLFNLMRLLFFYQNKYDKIYVFGFWYTIISRLVPNLRKEKLIIAIRWNPNFKSLKGSLLLLTEMVLSFRVGSYICNSKVSCDNLNRILRIFGRPKAQCIYNGITVGFTNKQKLTRSTYVKNFVLVANFSRNKGVFDAIDLVEKVLAKEPNITLTIYGKGYKNFIKNKKVSHLIATGSLHFGGYVSNVVDCLYKYDAMISMSKSEGVPTSMLEAISVNLPVIAYDVDGVSEIIHSGRNGVLLKNGDLDGFIDSVINLDKMLPKHMKVKEYNATQLVKFSRYNFVSHHLDVFND